jgi:protein-tyrosine phosphatase
MKGYIDIHCHLLYGVDDGADELSTTVKMLEIANEQNISEIIVTPHYHPARGYSGTDEIKHVFQIIEKNMKESFPKMKLYLGHEVYYTDDFSEQIRLGNILTMAESNYVLIEFMYEVSYMFLKQAVNNIIFEGYWPIIAHVERYPCFSKRPDLVQELVNMGAYIQVNSSSITGSQGWGIKREIIKLMKLDLVHFIATDAHSANRRAPMLLKTASIIKKKLGLDYCNKVLYDNPKKIINNQY